MKFLKINIISLVFVIFLFKTSAFSENKIYATYTNNNLTIQSYSKSWNENMLESLYKELLNNFHGEEFNYLSNIYIYPDSPEGVNGLYFDDIYIDNGYKLGNKAYINLYNGEKLNTISKMAYTLSHEYGHHYLIYNLLESENIYYNNLKNSKYINIRNLKNKPIVYDQNDKDYVYHWDIAEIMADDYVQLLGSSTAKASYDYKSVDELLSENKPLYNNPSSFNLKPSLNPYIPLAADVPGLYTYFLNLSGFTASQPKPPIKPVLGDIKAHIGSNNEPTYNISFDNQNKNDILEFTLVIYPQSNPFVPYPLKTLTSKEPLNITFGSFNVKDKNNKIKSISQKFEGNHTLVLYIKDSLGFIYSSQPKTYNFTKINDNLKIDNKLKENSNKNAKEPTKETTTIKETTNTDNKTVNKAPDTPENKFIGPSVTGSLDNIFNTIKY